MNTILRTSSKISILVSRFYITGKIAMIKNKHIHININPDLLPELVKNCLFKNCGMILDIKNGNLIIKINLLKRYSNSIKSHKTYKIRRVI